MFGRVTAQHLATGLANPQVYPAAIYPHTLFTAKYWIVGLRDQGSQAEITQMLTVHRAGLGER